MCTFHGGDELYLPITVGRKDLVKPLQLGISSVVLLIKSIELILILKPSRFFAPSTHNKLNKKYSDLSDLSIRCLYVINKELLLTTTTKATNKTDTQGEKKTCHCCFLCL